MKRFKIQGDKDTVTGEQLFWSNDQGWVDFTSATVFLAKQRIGMKFPGGVKTLALAWLDKRGEIMGVEILKLPKRVY